MEQLALILAMKRLAGDTQELNIKCRANTSLDDTFLSHTYFFKVLDRGPKFVCFTCTYGPVAHASLPRRSKLSGLNM